MDKSRKDNIPFIILSERVGEDQMELVRGIKGWTYIKLDFFVTYKWDDFSSAIDHKVLSSARDFTKG